MTFTRSSGLRSVTLERGGAGTRLEPHNVALAALQSLLDFCLVEAETSPVVTLVRALALQSLPSFCQSFWGAEAVVRFARLREGGQQEESRPGFGQPMDAFGYVMA